MNIMNVILYFYDISAYFTNFMFAHSKQYLEILNRIQEHNPPPPFRKNMKKNIFKRYNDANYKVKYVP